jgi:hypothetical protein
MSRTIEIIFPVRDHIYVHQVRNFAEELSRSLALEAGWGNLPMDDADRATTHIFIGNVNARKVSRVLAFVKKLLEKHYLQDGVKVSVPPGSI